MGIENSLKGKSFQSFASYLNEGKNGGTDEGKERIPWPFLAARGLCFNQKLPRRLSADDPRKPRHLLGRSKFFPRERKFTFTWLAPVPCWAV